MSVQDCTGASLAQECQPAGCSTNVNKPVSWMNATMALRLDEYPVNSINNETRETEGARGVVCLLTNNLPRWRKWNVRTNPSTSCP